MSIDITCAVCRIRFRVAPAHHYRVCCSHACAAARRDQMRLPPAVAAERARLCKLSYVRRRRIAENAARGRACAVCGFVSLRVALSESRTCSTTCAAQAATKAATTAAVLPA